PLSAATSISPASRSTPTRKRRGRRRAAALSRRLAATDAPLEVPPIRRAAPAHVRHRPRDLRKLVQVVARPVGEPDDRTRPQVASGERGVERPGDVEPGCSGGVSIVAAGLYAGQARVVVPIPVAAWGTRQVVFKSGTGLRSAAPASG